MVLLCATQEMAPSPWRVLLFGEICLLAANQAALPKPPEITAEAAEFFEKNVRPVLAQNCLGCHGENLQMVGLRLDSRDAVLKGTGQGHIVVIPGEPEKSALVQAIRYTGKIKMPPTGKLPDKDIEALTEWIMMGAPWPAVETIGQGHPEARKAGHWSFQPVSNPAPPIVKNTAWVKSPLDAFILAKLDEKGMLPARAADRRTLIRRATYDLTGLPPTLEEVAAFESDRSPNAFEKMVDRLLASPHYGERWGRHWLDLARYGDTKGFFFVTLPEELRYPFAYTYRDWIVRAFNEDLPYDRILIYQVAADQLNLGNDKRSLAAMGFLTLGRRFQNNLHDIIDDRLDVVFRGTQSLTIGCARCHDHKYDPIPTRDYYSLYGVFAGSEEKIAPLMVGPEEQARYEAYDKELKKREQRLKDFLNTKRTELLPRFRSQVEQYLLAAHAAQMLKEPERKEGLHLVMVERWRAYLEKRQEGFDSVFAPWHAFSNLAGEEFPDRASVLIKELISNQSPDKTLNPLVIKALTQEPPKSMSELARLYSELLKEVDQLWQQALTDAENRGEPPQGLSDPVQEQVRRVLYGDDSPTDVPAEGKPGVVQGIDTFFDEASVDQLRELKESLLQWSLAVTAPPHSLILEDAETPKNPHVFIRGKPDSLGEEVPRQFLSVLRNEKQEPFKQGSGRLELGQALASKDNPLTARVMVNRVWLHLFGAGLVRTPSDFGLRSEPPSHPELLDYLARSFMDDGWSVKRLIRRIMLASVYQQSDEENPEYRLKDPENRLLWRMNRRRKDFESLRDALLFTANRLDTKMGGPAVELTAQPFSRKRTMYGFIDRENLPGMFQVFDFASPATHSPQRINTTVPQQALFMMNSPFVVEQARQIARRLKLESRLGADRKVQYLYELLYQRAAAPEEVALGLHFIDSSSDESSESPSSKARLWQYGYGHYDERSQRVVAFQAFPHWTGENWQMGPKLPHPQFGRLMLNAEGGHPGRDLQHAAIRRWVAPWDGTVAIHGTLTAPPFFSTAGIVGDGVRGHVVSSRLGELGSWIVHVGFAETKIERVEIKQGDTIDVVVDCRSDPQYDSFTWAPTIRLLKLSTGGGSGSQTEWDAAMQFNGPEEKAAPPLTRWEKYAQVLLMSNEFLFID